MYLKSENSLFKSLKKLKKSFKIEGIKSEFEAEGSNNENIIKLRSLANLVGTQLHVKIGGVEAINDIYFCIESSVDGVIAPMVETKFGLKKFIDSLKKLKLHRRPILTINIETITGVKNIDSILEIANNNIDNITIGRSDLAQSYFNDKISQNSKIIEQQIFYISKKAKKYNINCTVGGGIDKETLILYKNNKNIRNIKKIETRKVIFKTKYILNKANALNEALEFEKKYILYKKEINDLKMKSEISRLTNLEIRK